MECPFDINHLFPERISILDHNLAAGRKSVGRTDVQVQISTVIDELGRASAKAQQLTAPITSASKLQSNKHLLYLLKDEEGNGGRGVVVGFLKVGYKKLFLLDQRGVHIEAEPLCVLDFYITESLQRHGYGMELFDFMLQHKHLEPGLMAYDRPSPKFLSFLVKHYSLTESVPQVNNFVVFISFFLNRSAAQLRKTPPKKPEGEIKPYSLMEREVVRKERKVLPWPFVHPAPLPQSPTRSASSPCSRSPSAGSSPSKAAATPPAPGTPRHHLLDNCRAKRTSQQGLVARGNLYSRHMEGRGLSLLLARQTSSALPGVGPVLTHSQRRDTGGQTDTHRPPPLLSLPPLSAVAAVEARLTKGGREAAAPSAAVGLATRGVLPQVGQAAGKQPGWSWTAGEGRCTAHWVKRKQECKSTRPW